MKKLTLIRHAKSDWTSDAERDVDRPLNRRGNKTAPRMAKRIVERGSTPEYLLSSPARRALETTRLPAKGLDLPEAVVSYDRSIYDASLTTLIEVVRNLPDVDQIALIGRWLYPPAPEWLPTCAVLELTLELTDWSALTPGCARLRYYDYPKKEGV
ncbi:MAG: histidine phosphatase family protein [Desulfuromonadales bacterium]|nr:histidine phosphatase family protein [Desulfuromonadales bacterium]